MKILKMGIYQTFMGITTLILHSTTSFGKQNIILSTFILLFAKHKFHIDSIYILQIYFYALVPLTLPPYLSCNTNRKCLFKVKAISIPRKKI